MKPVLCITIGDPAGIGPEIAVKTLTRASLYDECVPVLSADKAVIKRTLEDLNLGSWELIETASPREAKSAVGKIYYIPGNVIENQDYKLGEVSAICGHAAFTYVINGIKYAMEKKVDAVVTGPLNKEALHLGGHNYSGHTEIFAEYTGTDDYAMMLASKNLRVIHVSTHVSLREACDRATKERVLKTIKLARDAMVEMGIDNPSIGVSGLNPHSSENGLFGTEEETGIIPAIKQAVSEGINVVGPIPPDTVFVKALGGDYDIVVAMYHDQGHIPLKLNGFKMNPVTKEFTSVSGINCTIGLPIIRTSVDHGTAFDRAGKGIANEESLLDAIEMAVKIASSRNK